MPPDLGSYTFEKHAKCVDNLPRRRDVTHCPMKRTLTVKGGHNLAIPDGRPTEWVQTEQGFVEMGVGPVEYRGEWKPTVAQLLTCPYVDTRRTAISDRYYR